LVTRRLISFNTKIVTSVLIRPFC